MGGVTSSQETVPGLQADRPSEIPKRGWFQIVKRAWKEAKKDAVPLLAAGVAFYAFLALVPTLIALILLYGLVSSPAQVQDQVESFGSALPSEVEELLETQMNSLVETSDRALGIGLIIALLLALWSASGGISDLITALNVAYDEEDERGFVKSRLLALGLTLGAIIFMVLAVALVAALPVLLDALDLPGWLKALVQAGRWLGLVIAVMVALAIFIGWDRSGCAEDPLVVDRCDRGDRSVGHRFGRLLPLRRQLRVLRRDLRHPGRRRRPTAVAVAQLLCGAARRRGRRRDGAADRSRTRPRPSRSRSASATPSRQTIPDATDSRQAPTRAQAPTTSWTRRLDRRPEASPRVVVSCAEARGVLTPSRRSPARIGDPTSRRTSKPQ